MTNLVRKTIEDLVTQAARRAMESGVLPRADLPDVPIERPQNPEHGDYASSLPMKLARGARMNPVAIAEHLVKALEPSPVVEKAVAARPGFINFTLSVSWLKQQVEQVRQEGDRFGSLDVGKGRKVQVEFVSVNPTGPMHVGHGRGGVLGSALANVLEAAGSTVEREYYVNDAGLQIDLFNRSLWARYLQALGRPAELPAEGYQGEYMVDLGREFASEHGDRFARMPEEQGVKELGVLGQERIIASIKSDLETVGVTYDVWFRESSLFASGANTFLKVMEALKQRGFLVEKDNAQWFASTALGEDKDNVLVRGTGVPTYFASDAAYHYNKFVERGFDRVIDIWGADHRGHVSRMLAMAEALGIDPKRLQIIIYQLVTLKRGEEVVRVSKRTGNIVTLREVLEEVGPDACRFFFLLRSADSQMDFDLELAKQQSQDNPVYYVQYAHARIASILRLAQERGVHWQHGDVSLLGHPAELILIRHMLRLPEIVETIAVTLEPHHLPHYAMELATQFHQFYKLCRVLSDDTALTAARLKLVEASRVALARTLGLMGVSAPETM